MRDFRPYSAACSININPKYLQWSHQTYSLLEVINVEDSVGLYSLQAKISLTYLVHSSLPFPCCSVYIRSVVGLWFIKIFWITVVHIYIWECKSLSMNGGPLYWHRTSKFWISGVYIDLNVRAFEEHAWIMLDFCTQQNINTFFSSAVKLHCV